MKAPHSSLSASTFYGVMACAVMICQFGTVVQPAQGAALYWDVDASPSGNNVDGTGLGGTGTWDLATATWWNGSSLVAWPNTSADTAFFSAPPALLPTLNTVTLSSGITASQLSFLRSGYLLTGGDLTLAGSVPTLSARFAEMATIDSQILGTGGLTVTGGGTVLLTNSANSYTGTTTVSNGILAVTSNGALGADSSTIVVTGSATRGVAGGALMLAGGYGSGVTLARNVSLQGLGPVPAFGSALLSVGDNTITGTLSNGSGTVNTGISSAGGRLTLRDVSLTGTTGTIFMTVGVGSSLASVPGSGSYAITGVLSGTASIQKSGGGTLIIDPTSATGYSGTFRLYSGSIRFESVGAFGSNTGTGTLSTLDLAGDSSVLEVRMDAPSIGKNVYNRGGGSPTIAVDHAIGSSAINGTAIFGTLSYDDGETITFSGRNGYGASFQTAPVFTGDGNTAYTNNLTGTLLFVGDLWGNLNNTGARTMTIGGTGNTTITGSVIATAADFAHILTKSGAGTLTILGTASTYSGATNLSGGTLAIAGFGSITNNTSVVNIGSTTTAAVLDIIGNNLTSDQMTTSKVINLAGTTGGASILADQTGSSPALIFNAAFTATGAGVKTLTLGGENMSDNTINGAIVDSTAATSVLKSGSGTWVLAGANTYSGMTIVTDGTLKIQASTTGTNVLLDSAAVGLKFGTAPTTAVGTAGGVFQYVGAVGVASAETIGALLPGTGSGTIRVTPGIAGGTATLTIASIAQSSSTTLTTALTGSGSATLTVASTAGLEPGMRLLNGSAAAYVVSIASATSVVVSANQVLASGAVLNFGPGNATVNYAPDAGGSVVIASVSAAGLLGSSSYFNGADFAYAPSTVNAILRAPVYGTDAGFVTAGAALTANSNNRVIANTSTGAATILSLKIDGGASPVLTQTGLLTIRTGAAGTTGGILVTGGTATINGTGVTTGGAADLFIRVDGASDTLFLNAPVTSTTTGGLIKTGAGTLVIGGANAQTTNGITQLQEGTIKLATGGRLSANSVNFYMRQDTVFDLNGINVSQSTTTSSIGIFSGAGTVTNTSGTTATFAIAGSGGVFNGSIDEVNGRINVVKMGTSSTQVFNGLSNYTGSTTIGVPGNGTTGTLSAFYLADIGQDSSIGRGDKTSLATNQGSLIFGGTTGGLVYIGTTSVSTDRLFTMAGTVATAGATITNNAVNSQALIFSNTGPIAFASANPQLLQLGGTSTGDSWFYPQITDSGTGANITSLNKLGAGVWILGNTNNIYTGSTTITEGILVAQDGSSLPSSSGLILGGTTTGGIFQSTGNFTRDLAASASAGANTVSWNTALTTGSSGFAASSGKLVVAIGGLASPTALTWNVGGFMGTTSATTASLVLNSTTALGEVEFRNSIDLAGAVRTITVNDNTTTYTDFATITGAISGSGGIIKAGAGLLQLFGANTYTGTTSVTAGTLVVTSLGSSTLNPGASSVGDSTNGNTQAGALLLGNASTTAGILQYVGTGEISDRMIRLNTTTGNTQILADGSGALILTNVLNDMAAGAKILYLRGGNTQGNMITSVLADNAGKLTITADQGATWILSGANTYSGTTNVLAGALGAGSNTAFGISTLVLRNGALFAYGADRTLANAVSITSTTSGGTSVFMGDYNLTMNGDWIYNNTTTGHTITNGMTAGKTLTLNGDMVMNALTGNVSIAINGTGNITLNGDIVTSTSNNISLSYTGDGTFTFSGVNPTAGATTLNNNNGTMRLIGAGKLGTGNLTVNAGTLLIESVNQSVGTLAMGNVGGTTATVNVASGLTLSVTAVTFSGTTTLPSIITGNGTLALGNAGISVTVADNATQAADMIWNIANLTGSGTFNKLGTGVLDLSGIANNNFTGTYQVSAGAIMGLDALSNNLALNGGVYQTSGTFTRSLGTGANQVQFLAAGGGFAAVGGDLTVTFAGAPTPLVWGGTPSFVPNGGTLFFGSTGADGVTTFTHDIDLNGAVRTISAVDNTTVTTDAAVLPGVISNGAITKTGNGILRLGGANTFNGAVTVSAGTLQFSTVSNNGGGPSNLGQGTDGITLAGRLQFIGGTNQTTDRAITISGAGILDASGTGGASITFAGAITAGSNNLNLDGTGDGFLNAKATTAGDFVKSGSGTWTINAAQAITDDVFVSAGTLVFNALNTFDGDDVFIRAGTLKLGINGALTNAMDDLNISSETATGGIFDINGTTGSAATDIIIGSNPANQGTAAALSGSLIDSLGGGSFSSSTLNVRNGVVSANMITSGTVTLGNVISNDAGGTNTTSGTISGPLTLNGGSLALFSGAISGDITFAAGIATTKSSSSTVTLSGNNTVAGAGSTTIGAGTLVLDHSTKAGSKISDGALTMNGGTLQILGNASAAVTDTVGNLTLGSTTDSAPVVVKIDTAGAATTLAVGSITRAAGATLRFNPSTTSGHLTTSATNTAVDLLGGWATYQLGSGPAQFATISGGEIVGFTSTVMNDVTTWTAGGNITDSTGFTGTLASSISINSLRFDAASGISSVNVGSGNILDIASGGILITNSVAAGNPTISGGRITAGTFNELVVTQDGAAPFTLTSRLAASVALTKAGSGLMVLNQAANTSVGTIRIIGGTLQLRGGGALGDRASVIMEATIGALLDVLDSETIGSLSGGDSSNYRNMSVRIAAGKTLTINQIVAGTFYGDISAASGTATFNKTGAATLTLNDGIINLGAGGVINVLGGRLAVDVNGANTFVQNIPAGTTINIGAGASFFIDHNDVTATGGIAGGRIADNVVFNLNSTGSTTDGLYYRDDENIGVTEVIGAVNLVSGVNSIRVDSSTTSGNTSQNIILQASSITRSNQATLVLRGTGIQATGNPRAQFQDATVLAGFGTGTGTSLPVIPWAIGPAAGGTVAADSFLTTAGTAGAAWRPLNLATEYAIVTDAATWAATASTQNVLVSATTSSAVGTTVRSLLMSMGAGTVDLSGTGTLTVDSGGFLFSGTGSSTLGGFSGIGVNPLANEYVFHVVGGTATINSLLSTVTAKLTKSGAGTLILSASNTGLGDIALNEGILQISDLDNIGGNTGTLLFAGGTLRLDATAYSGDDLSTRTFVLLPGGGTVDTNGNNITFNNAFGTGSSGGFTKAGAGTLTLNAQAGYTGGTTISGGTLLYGVADALPAMTNLTLAGGTLDTSVFSATLAGLSLTANGTLNGNITVTGDVQVDGGGSRTLTVNNSSLTTFSGGVFYLVNSGTSARTTTLNGTGNILISDEITNGTAAGSLTYSGSGTLTLTGNNTYTGTTTLNNNAGTLVFSGASQLSGMPLTVNAGTVQLNPAFDQTIGNLTMGGGAAGSSSNLQIGAGKTLTLTGTVTFSSTNNPLAATINGGAGAILDFGGVARTFNIGDSSNAEPDMIIGANVTLQNDGDGGLIKTGSGTLHIAGTNNLTGPITIQAGAVTGNLGTGNLLLNNGVFEGNGTFTRSLGTGGGQVQWVAGAGGGFAASGGALTVTLAGAPDPLIWDSTPFFVSGAGALIFGSTTADSVVTFTHNIDLNNTASAVTRTVTVNDNTDVTTDKAVLSGNLTSSGAGAVTLAKTGAGVLELAGANTFSGLTVSAGTLQFSTASNIGGGPSNLGQGSTISMGAATLSFIGSTSQSTNRAITMTGAGTLSANGTGNATITYAGAISTAGNSINLTGTGEGFITGGITQTSNAADLNVNSGIWHLGTTASALADDIIVTATSTGTAVLNLDTPGILTYTSGNTSNGLYIRDGGVVNLNDNDVNGAANSGGLDFIILGDTPTGNAGTLNTNTFNITVPRLDVGTLVSGRTGIVLGSGTITGTYTGTDYLSGFRFFDGSVSANLAGVATILKQGLGTVTLSGNNSGLTGTVAATRIDSGTLILDFTANNSNKISSSVALDMRGGMLLIKGSNTADTIQSVASTTFANSGSITISLTSGTGHSATLNLGAITRTNGSQDGTLRVVLPVSGAVTTTSGNVGTTGVLGGWATVTDATGTWFATNSAGTGLGNIVAVATSAKNDVSTWVAGDQITDSSTGFTGTLSSININTLRFDAAGGSALNVSNGAVLSIVSGGILMTSNVSSGPATISGGILAAGTNEIIFTQDSSQTLTVSSAIRTNYAVTKSGTGTLVLSGNNNYTDETEIQGGILQVSGGNGIGDTSLVTLSDDAPSMLQLLGDETIGRLQGGSATAGIDQLAVVDVGTHSLTVNESASTTYAGLLTGSGSLIKTGLGNLQLSNASSGFTGNITVNMGLLYFAGIGSSSASSFTLNSGSSLLIDNNGTTTTGARILDTASITMNSANGSWSGETIVSGLSIRRNQGSTLNETVGVITAMSGANYARLEATVASAAAAIIADDIVRQNGATLDVRGTNMSATSGTRAQLRIGTAANQTAFIASMVGGGSTTLGSKNISIVPWAIAEDTVDVGIADTNMGNSLATYVAGQGFRALSLATEYNSYTGSGATDNVRESLGADLTGLAGKTINALVIDNMAFANDISFMGAGAGQKITNTSGTFLFTLNTGATAGAAYSTTLGGFGSGIAVAGTNEYVFFVVNPSSAAGSATLTAAISSALISVADITKSGRGTLALTGTNTAGGGSRKTTINEGAIEITDLDNIGGDSGALIFAGGTLRLSSSYAGDDVSTRTITFLNGGGTIDTNGMDLILANSVGSGAGGFTKAGLGNLTLTAAATYTGTTTVSAGTLTIGADNAIGSGGDLIIGGGATLDTGSFHITAGLVSTTGASPFILGTGTITANAGFSFGNTGDIGVDAILAGSGGLLKTQTNVLTLTGMNTFSGPVEVQAGTLSFNSISNVGGGASALGSVTNAQDGIIHMGLTSGATTLIYTGAGSSSDRIIGMQGTTGGVTVDSSGTGALTLGGVRMETAGSKTLTLKGLLDPSFANTMGAINEYGLGALSVIKADRSTWVLSAVNAYSGSTSINEGILRFTADQNLSGALNFGSANTITTAGTLDLSSASATFGGAMLVQTNSTTEINKLVIGAGESLTVGGVVTLGSGATTSTTLFTASGEGTFNVINTTGTGVTFLVGNSNTNIATADFSSLATMNISLNTASGILQVSSASGTNSTGYGTLIFAKNTTLTASALTVGGGGSYNGNFQQVNALKLGTGTNTINVGAVNVGTGSRDIGSITFQDTTGTVTIRAADGVSAAAFNMGTGTSSTSAALPTGNRNTFDVSGHNADLLFSAVSIGTQTARTGPMDNLFAFDQGKLITGNLTMGSKGTAAGNSTNVMNLGGDAATIVAIGSGTGTAATLASNGGTGIVSATINVTGGTVTIGSGSGQALLLGSGNTNSAGSTSAALNVSGGNVTLATTGATAVTMAAANAGTANATISITGGTLTVQGAILRGAGSGTRNATITLNGGTLDMSGKVIGATGNAITFNAQSGTLKNLAELNGGGAFSKTTTGTLYMDGVNNYTGTTTVTAGTLQFVKETALYNNNTAKWTDTNIVVNATATAAFNVGGSGEFTAADVDAIKTLGTNTGGFKDGSTIGLDTSNASGGNFTYGGVIANTNGGVNAVGFSKLGTNTLTLTGTSTYTAATTVAAGTLQVGDGTSGALAGAGSVTVSTGATLSGSGSIAGSTVISSGAFLAPGVGATASSNQTLTFTSIGIAVDVRDGGQIQLGLTSSSQIDTTFNASGTDALTYLNANGGASGSAYTSIWAQSGDYDTIKLTNGTFNLGSTAGGTIKLLNNGLTVSNGSIFKLLDWSTVGTLDSLAGSGSFTLADLDLSSLLGSGLSFDMSAFTTYGVIVVIAVPEPSKMLLLMLALSGFMLRRRR